MYIPVPYQLNPYHYQMETLRAVYQGKNVVSVIHRRAGKDTICIQIWLLRALMRVGTHIYLFPMLKQAREVIWEGIDFDGKPFISYIPECLIAKKNEARMEITLINGSRMVLAGSNNFNSHMGSNPVTIIYSEFSLHNPQARQYMHPILIQNGGIEVLQFTPRGQNHAYDILETVRHSSDYFVQTLNCEQTFKHDGSRVISNEQIKKAKEMGMSDEMIRQEFYIDFEVGNQGAYFTREINDAITSGRMTTFLPNPNLPLHTVWDLGGTDATACWIFQLDGDYINLLSILHETGQGLKYFLDQAEMIRQKYKCHWGYHFGPHDIKQEHQGWENTESRLMKARKAGWNFLVTPKTAHEDGIEAMRYVFPKLRFHKVDCALGIRAVREYQREWDEVKGRYKPNPLENWAVHLVDALRYLCVNYRRLYSIPLPPTKYETPSL